MKTRLSVTVVRVVALPTLLMAPYDVLDHVRFRTKDAPRVFTVAPTAGPVRTFEGLTLTPHYMFASAPPVDLLVVPSAEHSMDTDLEDEALSSAGCARRGARRSSSCRFATGPSCWPKPVSSTTSRRPPSPATRTASRGCSRGFLDWSRLAVKHRVAPGARVP